MSCCKFKKVLDDAGVKPFVPSLKDVEEVSASSKKVSGVGEDVIPPELPFYFPQFFAALYFPIYERTSLSLVEPVQWKGGTMQEVWKVNLHQVPQARWLRNLRRRFS